MCVVASLHEWLGEFELRRGGSGRHSRPPRCSSPEAGAPAKEWEMVRRSRSVVPLDWLSHRVRALLRAEVSSWACCVLSSKSGLCISNCCPLPPSALPPTLLLSLIPVNPCGLVVPLPLKMSYFVAVHSAGVSLAPSDSLHSTDPPTRPHADRA